MNERTHFFIKNIPLTVLFSKGDVGCVCERWAGDGNRLLYWPQVLLIIAVLLPHLGWVAQPWVTEGPRLSVYRWLSIRHLVFNWLQLARTASGAWLYNCLSFTCFRCSSAYSHRCISWLMARSRVNMLQSSHSYFSKFHRWNFLHVCLHPPHTHISQIMLKDNNNKNTKKLLESQQKKKNIVIRRRPSHYVTLAPG